MELSKRTIRANNIKIRKLEDIILQRMSPYFNRLMTLFSTPPTLTSIKEAHSLLSAIGNACIKMETPMGGSGHLSWEQYDQLEEVVILRNKIAKRIKPMAENLSMLASEKDMDASLLPGIADRIAFELNDNGIKLEYQKIHTVCVNSPWEAAEELELPL